ncbi:MAG: BrnT family toxin [Vicinamibacteria bacterium]
MSGIEFEWDSAKAEANLAKHGVTFEEALAVFVDPIARIHPDPDHSESEPREIIIGHSIQQRLLLVSFTERGERIRLISARPATKRERRDYEEESKG